MAGFPEFQASVQPEPLPGRAYPHLPEGVSSEDSGAGVGRGIESVGDVMNRVAVKAQDDARRVQYQNADNQIGAISTDLTHNPQTGALTLRGQDAFGLNGKYLPQFDERTAQVLANIPDPRARAMAAARAGEQRNMLTAQLDTHEINQHKEFATQTYTSGMEQSIQRGALNYNHPDILADSRQQLLTNLGSYAHEQGWDPSTQEGKQVIDDHRDAALTKFHGEVLDAELSDKKVHLADQYLESIKGDLKPEVALHFRTLIDAKEKELAEEGRAQLTEKAADYKAAVMMGLPVPIGSRPTKGEFLSAFPKDGDRRYLDSVVLPEQTGAAIKTFSSLNSQQIDEAVERLRPTTGGMGTATRGEMYDAALRARNQTLTDRAKDPAGFAVEHSMGWTPLNFQAPDQVTSELRKRQQSAPELAKQIGVTMPLLTGNEAWQLSSTLDATPPSGRLPILYGLRKAAGNDEAYGSILGQVAPHSPVTAVAGNLLPTEDAQHTPIWFTYDGSGAPLRLQSRATTILRGEELTNPDKTAKAGEEGKGGFKGGYPMPKETYLQQEFASKAGDLFATRPGMQNTYYAAYRAAYASIAADGGIIKEDGDNKVSNAALETVFGATLDFQGRRMAVPSGMDPQRFNGLVTAAVNANLTKAGLPMDYLDKKGGYTLEERGMPGSGRYYLTHGGEHLEYPNGRPIQVDLKQQYSPASGAPVKSTRPETSADLANQTPTIG